MSFDSISMETCVTQNLSTPREFWTWAQEQESGPLKVVPPNLRFIIDDVNQDWSFPPESFDFIHARCLGGGIDDWSVFMRRCFDLLKPGGRIEITECRPKGRSDDGSYPEDSYLRKWEKNEFARTTQIQGRVWDIAPELPGLLEGAAFKDINVAEYPCPIGTWPKDPKLKEIGRYFRAQMVQSAVEGYSLALFTRFGGWKPIEVQVLLAHLRGELKTNKMHVYTKA
ncbi:hypothetical protein N7462_000054 [Penicillium macrosclerotiorum]|uniref:uncharacterized protein n=1 Tax=Penicillium macrosclerotiorum TaxID=303699 RepID=UPI002546D0D9|nr:uncharacterized protein N7462_000054 [Penicillium macrosclerotiorum]KAJ5698049.1 hypothetical protein N7462_000054 [Penicillium macrosclerotiorum]